MGLTQLVKCENVRLDLVDLNIKLKNRKRELLFVTATSRILFRCPTNNDLNNETIYD